MTGSHWPPALQLALACGAAKNGADSASPLVRIAAVMATRRFVCARVTGTDMSFSLSADDGQHWRETPQCRPMRASQVIHIAPNYVVTTYVDPTYVSVAARETSVASRVGYGSVTRPTEGPRELFSLGAHATSVSIQGLEGMVSAAIYCFTTYNVDHAMHAPRPVSARNRGMPSRRPDGLH